MKYHRHGHTRDGVISSEYRSWYNMIDRCERITHEAYERYGGRGITVCKRWHNFTDFIADMGLKPGPGYSIERKDNDLGYSPDNCYWATRTQQNRNKRTNKLNEEKVLYIRESFSSGEMSAARLAKLYQVDRSVIYGVINRVIWK